MLYSEFLRLKYQFKTKAGLVLLLFYMLFSSILLVRAIPRMVALYNTVGLTYQIDNFFFLWFGYYRFISISDFRLLFFATRIFPFIFLPMLLSWFGGDTFSSDYTNQCDFLLYLRVSRKKYFIEKLLMTFIGSFVIVLIILVFQLLLSVLGCLYLKQKGILIPDFERDDLLILLSSGIRIPLYYSSLAALSCSITLFIHIPAATYMLPVVIAVGSSVLTAELTNNVPMDLAFYDSGLMAPNMEIYWYTVIMYLTIVVFLTLVKICIEKDALKTP